MILSPFFIPSCSLKSTNQSLVRYSSNEYIYLLSFSPWNMRMCKWNYLKMFRSSLIATATEDSSRRIVCLLELVKSAERNERYNSCDSGDVLHTNGKMEWSVCRNLCELTAFNNERDKTHVRVSERNWQCMRHGPGETPCHLSLHTPRFPSPEVNGKMG